MADPVATVERIVKIGLKIKDAVDTVRHNVEDCQDMKKRVLRFSAILSQLQQSGLMNDTPALSGALEDLEESLEHALELVTACQETSTIRRLVMARDLSKQLRRVKEDILNKVMLASFAINAHTTIVLLTIQAGGHPHPPPRQLEDAGLVEEVSHSSQSTNDVETNVLDGLTKFSLSELQTATNDFSHENLIGHGGFSVVYKGVLHNGLVVAIKRRVQAGQTNLYPLYAEATILSKLQHKNVTKFLGIYVSEVELDQEDCAFLIEEYIPNGYFEHIINGSKHIDWPTRLRIIQGIAEGIHYLHEHHIVHLDFNPRNILLDSDINPVITDFGLAQRVHEHEPTYVTEVIGSIGYTDPIYMDTGLLSKASDMYGFGVTLLETIMSMSILRYSDNGGSRQRAAIEQALNALKDKQLMKKLFDPSQFNKLELEEIKRCIMIGVLCINLDQSKRPMMQDVLQMLNGNKKIPRPQRMKYYK